MLHIQEIKKQWYKHQRGAKDAHLRAMPDALPSDSLQHFTVEENKPFYKIGSYLSFLRTGENLVIRTQPEAGSSAKRLFVLEPQQWVRLNFRSRYAMESTWCFQHFILNVFWGDVSKLPLNYFIATDPVKTIKRELDGFVLF